MSHRRPRWTVLAYFAGEKDLAEAMVLSLKDMYRVGVGSGCRLVAQFNRVDSTPQRFLIGGNDTRRSPERASVPEAVPRDVDGRLSRLGTLVSTEPLPHANHWEGGPQETDANRAALESFVSTGIRENPSEHYLLILSGHASGVVGKGDRQPGFSPGALRTLDLGPALRSVQQQTGRVIDVLGIDACLMGMCEVAWELRDSVRFLVTSEGLAPQFGWPYHRILEILRDDDPRSPREVARAICSKYLRFRADFDLAAQSVDLAACNLSRAGHLASAVTDLCRVMLSRLRDPVFRDALVLAHWKVQSYKSEQYADLWDFCDLLSEVSRDPRVRDACRHVMDAVSSPDDGIVEKAIFHGSLYQHSHGLSIYFPWSVVAPEYEGFDFAKATGWLTFLMRSVLATRREVRRGDHVRAPSTGFQDKERNVFDA